MKNAQIYINGVPIKKATRISLLPRRSLWQKIKDKINFYKRCFINSRCKIPPIKQYLKTVGEVTQYIGIAADERERETA